MALPSFIIGGAPKAGTTALWAYLVEHPQVFMPSYKEPHFFSKLQGNLGNGIVKPGPERAITYYNGIQWYESLFEPGRDAKARGEASTHYFSAPDAAGLIKAHLPNVRLIFLLRDPVGRLYSQYWQTRRLGAPMPEFESLFRMNHPALTYFCYVSKYRTHIERFFSEFPRDRVLIILDTDLKNHPVETLQRVYRFIDVDTEFIPSGLGRAFNPNTSPKSRSLENLLTILRHSRPSKALPEKFREPLAWVRRLVSKLNTVHDRYPPLSDDIRSDLIKRFDVDISYVESLLGVSLESWRLC